MVSVRALRHQMPLSENLIAAILLLIILFASMITIAVSLTSISPIPSSGTVNHWPRVDVTLDVSTVIGVNNLSLGFMLDHQWDGWCDSSIRRGLSQDANFKLVRVFDFREASPSLMPVIKWNESAKTGTFNWTNVDTLVQRIFEIGAEPLFTLGWTHSPISNNLPVGMAVDPATELPYPGSYAAYAASWVKHFKALGWPVRFYEIFNEPFSYLGWYTINYTRLGYFKDVWNATASAMRRVNPKVLLSFDFITQKKVLDYWVQYGCDIDYLDAHKYDASTLPGYNDTEIFRRAETFRFEDSVTFYGFDDAKQKWFSTKGKMLPTIISESNLNAAHENGTDPRMQQMAGAVRTALVLRKGILKGLNYFVYYSFSSSIDYSSTNGYGFGMVNSIDNQPLYPYYVQQILGSNLGIGNSILKTTSSSEDIRTLAWIHNGTINIFLVCKADEQRAVYLQGVRGQLNFQKIDGTVSFLTPQVQRGIMNGTEPLRIHGYTVMLLQTPIL